MKKMLYSKLMQGETRKAKTLRGGTAGGWPKVNFAAIYYWRAEAAAKCLWYQGGPTPRHQNHVVFPYPKMEPRKGLRPMLGCLPGALRWTGFLAQWSGGTGPCIGHLCRRNCGVSVQRSATSVQHRVQHRAKRCKFSGNRTSVL